MPESDDYDFTFQREDDGHVWCSVTLGYGFVMEVWSEEANSPRDWTIESVDVLTDISRENFDLHPDRLTVIPYKSDLGRALAAAFDRWVRVEHDFARGKRFR